MRIFLFNLIMIFAVGNVFGAENQAPPQQENIHQAAKRARVYNGNGLAPRHINFGNAPVGLPFPIFNQVAPVQAIVDQVPGAPVRVAQPRIYIQNPQAPRQRLDFGGAVQAVVPVPAYFPPVPVYVPPLTDQDFYLDLFRDDNDENHEQL